MGPRVATPTGPAQPFPVAQVRAGLLEGGVTLLVQSDPAQEMQIALLVSEGRTNAEVGRAVFLSTRTVEFHLSRAYRKLGVASRTELARQMASAQPADT